MEYVIVDDEKLARSRLVRLIGEVSDWQCLGEADCAHNAFELINQHKPDVVFLDINMPGESGLSLAKRLQQLPHCPDIVFVTAYSEYALDAFDVFARGYLVKPVERNKLKLVIDKFGVTVQAPSKIQYQLGHTTRFIDVESIIAALAEDKLTKIVFAGGSAYLDTSLKTLVKTYPSVFVQLHRNTLANSSLIIALESKADGYYAILQGLDYPLAVSRRLYPELKAMLTK